MAWIDSGWPRRSRRVGEGSAVGEVGVKAEPKRVAARWGPAEGGHTAVMRHHPLCGSGNSIAWASVREARPGGVWSGHSRKWSKLSMLARVPEVTPTSSAQQIA